METLADFGRASGLLYDDVPRDGGPTRTLPTREGVLAGAIGALLLLIGLAALGLLAATLVNTEKLNTKPTRDTCSIERSLDGSLDDRCAPCEQQNEEQRLSDFVRFQFAQETNVYGAYFVVGSFATSIYDTQPNNQDPLFPDTFQATWDTIHDAAVELDTSLLDPYEAITLQYLYQREHFFGWYANDTAQVDICKHRSKDWLVSNTPIGPAALMYGLQGESIPELPTSRGAWLLDAELFNFYADQLEQSISAVERRTAGDWWTVVYNDIQANGGVLRSTWVNNHLDAIAFELALSDPLAMPQPIKAFIANRGYAMTPTEEARMDDIIARYYAAQVDFFLYSLSTTPALVNPISFNTWALTYGWTDCFGYSNGLWYYGLNQSELMTMFLANKARIEALVGQTLAMRDALWPNDAWMAWQDTWLHYAFPQGEPNPLNISGWGFNPSQCDDINPATGLPLFFDTLTSDIARYYGSRYKIYNFANSQTAQHSMSTAFGGCAPFAGNAFTVFPITPRTTTEATPSVLIIQNPILTLNATFNVVVHENKHAAQTAAVAGTLCPTCWNAFMAFNIFGQPPTAVDFPYTLSDFLSYTFVEGPAVDAEMQAVEAGMTTEWETFHAYMNEIQSRNMRMITITGVRLGYWDLAGAVAWMNQWSWFPGQISSASIFQNSIREMTPTTGWYGLGLWYVKSYRARAQAACGAAFSAPAFNLLTHAIPAGPIAMWQRLFEEYIANNCTSPTTRFGDARRTVVAPSLRGM